MAVEETLARVELFADLEKQDLERIAKACVVREFRAGDIIVRENEVGVAFYVIDTGRVEVIKNLGTAGEQVLDSMGPASFVGEMALFDNHVRSASIRAVEDTRCLVLTKWDFNAELAQNTHIAVAMLAILARRIRHLDERAHTH
jgi:CRP/FNR family cyclic AMP-dependent transcriptional regulator